MIKIIYSKSKIFSKIFQIFPYKIRIKNHSCVRFIYLSSISDYNTIWALIYIKLSPQRWRKKETIEPTSIALQHKNDQYSKVNIWKKKHHENSALETPNDWHLLKFTTYRLRLFYKLRQIVLSINKFSHEIWREIYTFSDESV